MNKRLSLLYTALGFALLLGLMQFLSFTFYLSWSYWWFDILMHFMGGVTGGLAAYWVLFHSGIIFQDPIPSKRKAVLAVLVSVMIAGVGWEIMEELYGITDSNEGHVFDVVNDLIMDALGAVSAALICRKRSHG